MLQAVDKQTCKHHGNECWERVHSSMQRKIVCFMKRHGNTLQLQMENEEEHQPSGAKS